MFTKRNKQLSFGMETKTDPQIILRQETKGCIKRMGRPLLWLPLVDTIADTYKYWGKLDKASNNFAKHFTQIFGRLLQLNSAMELFMQTYFQPHKKKSWGCSLLVWNNTLNWPYALIVIKHTEERVPLGSISWNYTASCSTTFFPFCYTNHAGLTLGIESIPTLHTRLQNTQGLWDGQTKWSPERGCALDRVHQGDVLS